MESNNNKSKTSQQHRPTGPSQTNMTESHGGNPIDSTSVYVESRGNAAAIHNIQEPIDGNGFTIKQKRIRKAVAGIRQKGMTQLLLSLLRNALCWIAVVSIIILLTLNKDFADMPHTEMAVLIICLSMGLLGTGFHAARVYTELTYPHHLTVVGGMLYDPVTREEFQRMVQNRQLSAPEIFMEVSLRSGAMSQEDPSHWTRASRRTRKEMSYQSWADQSPSIQSFHWPDDRTSWVIVSKDFRCVDASSQVSMDGEVAEFKRETGYNTNKYFMAFDLSLQWKENDSCPDAEAFLVFEDVKPLLYDIRLYKISLFLAFDSLYRMLFHICVKKLDDYYIIKFIEK